MSFFEQEILPEIMQSLALGLITITIAITIFLTGRSVVFEFDRVVILKKVIRAKTFLVSLFCLFVPLFFWDFSEFSGRILLFVAYCSASAAIVKVLHYSYKWIAEIELKDKRGYAGYRQKKRFEYLKEPSDDPQKLLAWSITLQQANKSHFEEVNYIKIFIEHVNYFFARGKEQSVEEYILCLKDSIGAVTFSDDRVFSNIFEAVLEWHYKVFLLFSTNKENKKRYMRLIKTLEWLIKEIEKKGLSSGDESCLFIILEDFVDKKLKSAEGKNYIGENFIAKIAPTFFENVKSCPNRQDNWSDYFPAKWKIATGIIIKNDVENIIPRMWLHLFIGWAQIRIMEHYRRRVTDSEDEQLDELVRGLFLDVDPETWAIILTFALFPCGNVKERIQMLVEEALKFGLVPRDTYIPDADLTKWRSRRQEEWNNAIKLALNANQFGDIFFRENLMKYIQELDNQLSSEDGMGLTKKQKIRQIFEEMLRQLGEGETAQV